jgi:hypothetical protein
MITVEEILSCGPCDDYPEDRIRELAPSGSLTAAEVCDLPIPVEDRCWALAEVYARRNHRGLVRWAADCVETILPRAGYARSATEAAISAARRWADEPSENRLTADDAAYYAAYAARAAAYAAYAAYATDDAADPELGEIHLRSLAALIDGGN